MIQPTQSVKAHIGELYIVGFALKRCPLMTFYVSMVIVRLRKTENDVEDATFSTSVAVCYFLLNTSALLHLSNELLVGGIPDTGANLLVLK